MKQGHETDSDMIIFAQSIIIPYISSLKAGGTYVCWNIAKRRVIQDSWLKMISYLKINNLKDALLLCSQYFVPFVSAS